MIRSRVATVEHTHTHTPLAAPPPPLPPQIDKELQRATQMLEEVEDILLKKKEASRTVKELRAKIEAGETEVLHLTAEGQHLRRQRDTIIDRIQR